MESSFVSLLILLSIVWFIAYWILGGVFFAVMAILRLGRVRKVRFSCLFSVWALLSAVGAAYAGITIAQEAVQTCLVQATNKAQLVTALFGCGFAGVMGSFLIGAAVLVLGGFAIMGISKSKSRPWIEINLDKEGITQPKNDEPGGFFPS